MISNKGLLERIKTKKVLKTNIHIHTENVKLKPASKLIG